MNKKHFQNPGSQFRHFSSPHSSFQTIDWSDSLISVGLSDEGSNGVVFIETPSGSLVFKACDQVSTDMFLSKIAQKLDISSPKLRVIGYDSQEFKQMMRAIQKYCHTNQILYELISRRLNRPFYQLLEYIPCTQLNNIGKQRFHAIFENEFRLYQLGRILGFDIIMNNSDRLCLYWEMDGNANNVLFKVSPRGSTPLTQQIVKDKSNVNDVIFDDIVMIDARPTIIDKNNPEAAKNYEIIKETMCSFIEKSIRFTKQQNPVNSKKLGEQLFEQLNNMFYNYTSCKFNHAQMVLIAKSILICLYDFYVVFQIRVIEELVKGLKRENKLWEDTHWNEQLDKVHISYFEDLREITEKYVIPEEQLIRLWKAQNNFGRGYDEKAEQEEQPQQVPEQLLSIFNMDKKQQISDMDQTQQKDKQNEKQAESRSNSEINKNQQQEQKSQLSNASIKQPYKNIKETLEEKLSKFRTKNLQKSNQ